MIETDSTMMEFTKRLVLNTTQMAMTKKVTMEMGSTKMAMTKKDFFMTDSTMMEFTK